MIIGRRGRFTFKVKFDSGHHAMINQFHLKRLPNGNNSPIAEDLVNSVWDAFSCAEKHNVRNEVQGGRVEECGKESRVSGQRYNLRRKAFDPARYKD